MLDPGVDHGDGIVLDIDPDQIAQLIQFYQMLKETFNEDTEEQVEYRRIVDQAIEILLRVAPLESDRPSSGGDDGPIGSY